MIATGGCWVWFLVSFCSTALSNVVAFLHNSYCSTTNEQELWGGGEEECEWKQPAYTPLSQYVLVAESDMPLEDPTHIAFVLGYYDKL